MKKITRITTQQKNTNRYNIFLDDVYAFSVDESVLVEFRLRKGLELTSEMIADIKEQDLVHKHYTQAIRYLSYRMRTEKEVRDYLMRKGASPEDIEEIIARLTKEKLIDDREFAEMFVRSRIDTSTKGPKLIAQELQGKGVSGAAITEALETFTRELQYEKCHQFIEKKLKQSSRHSFRKRMEQIKMNLLNKGFSRDVVSEAAMEFTAEKNEDAEWDALVFQGEKLLRKYERQLSGYDLENKLKEGLYRRGFQFDLIVRFIQEYSMDDE